jgi:hypothetical protein
MSNLIRRLEEVNQRVTSTNASISALEQKLDIFTVIDANVKDISSGVSQLRERVTTSDQLISRIPILGDISNSIGKSNTTKSNKNDIINAAEKNINTSGISPTRTSDTTNSTYAEAVNRKRSVHTSASGALLDVDDSRKRFGTTSDIENVNEIISDRQTSINGNASLVFPPDLTSFVHTWISFSFKEYERPSTIESGTLTPDLKIYLPIPENYNESINVILDNTDAGIFGAVGDALTPSGEAFFNEIKSLSSESSDIDISGTFASGALKAFNEAGETTRRLIGQGAVDYLGLRTLDKLAPSIGGIRGQVLGTIPNPLATIFYRGQDLRDFTFSWKLVPRNDTEAKTINQIIKEVKKRSIANFDSGSLLLKYPNIVEPEIEGRAADKMGVFKRCMVKGISIIYTADGTSAFFHDGHPVAIQFTMTLQEIELLTKKDIKD